MSDSTHDDRFHEEALTPAQRAARDAVRALPPPAASEEFRARMRASFVRAEVPETPGEPIAASSVARRSAAPRVRMRSFVVPLAVAAALVVMIGSLNHGGGWTITGVGSNATVVINGKEVSCADLSPIEAALHEGCHIVVPEGGRMELANLRNFVFELGGGVEFTLPRTPGRWFGRDVQSEIGGNGTLRVATTEGFAGATYRLRTSTSELVVTGTAFTVIQSADSVCLCVLEGEVRTTLPDGSTTSVGAGRRVFVSNDGSVVDHGPMLEQERAALEALRARVDALPARR